MHPYRTGLILLGTDLLGFLTCYNLAHHARTGDWISLQSPSVWMIVVATILTLYVMDVYRTEEPETRSRLPLQTFFAVVVAGIVSTVLVYFLGIEEFSSLFGRGVLPVTFALFSLWAAWWRWLITHRQQKSGAGYAWLVIGEEETCEHFLAEMKPPEPDRALRRIDPAANADSLRAMLRNLTHNTQGNSRQPVGIVVATDAPLPDDLAGEIIDMRFSGITVLTLSEFYEKYWSKVPVLHLRNGWFIQTRGFELVHDRVGLRLKRVLDVVVAFVALVLTMPLLLIIALLVKLDSRGPAFYVQERTGLRGEIFSLYKFRTMFQDAEKDGIRWAGEKDPRVTRLGRLLRATRLDEFPQLWNILKGEMSLIGPRPERPEFIAQLEEQIPYYDLRHLVPPGATGWAQVMYPYGASVEDARKKLEYDLYYIKNHSIQLDLAIILKTFMVIFKGKGR